MARERTVSKQLAAGIYKRGDKYRVRTTYKGKSLSGTYDSYQEAIQGKAKLIADAKANTLLTSKSQNTTVKDCLMVWRNAVIPVKFKNVESEQSKVDVIINNFSNFVQIKVIELNTALVTKHFVDIRRKQKGRGNNKFISKKTIKYDLKIIRDALEHASAKGIATINNQNPVNISALVADISDSKNHRRILTDIVTGDSIEKEFIQACSEYSDGTLAYYVEFAIYTACRRTELLKLKWSDVHLDQKFMIVQNKNVKKKQDAETRMVPLGKRAIAVLTRMGIKKTGRVFAKYSHPDSITSAFKNIRNKEKYKGKFDGIVPHSLRHEAVTRELEKGLTTQQVQKLSGHKGTQILDRYSRQIAELKNTVADLID